MFLSYDDEVFGELFSIEELDSDSYALCADGNPIFASIKTTI